MRCALATIASLALLAGCSCEERGPTPGPEPESSPAPTPPSTPDDGFVYAPLRSRAAAAPARFDAPLPPTLEAFRGPWPDDRRPRAHVRDRVCAGDEEMGERFVTAIEAAARDGASPHELASVHGRMVEYCGSEAFCAWAAREVQADAGEATREVLWVGLARCQSEVVAPLIDGPSVPARALVTYHRRRVFADLHERLPVPPGCTRRRARSSACRATPRPTAWRRWRSTRSR